jgi:hypothetical protein
VRPASQIADRWGSVTQAVGIFYQGVVNASFGLDEIEVDACCPARPGPAIDICLESDLVIHFCLVYTMVTDLQWDSLSQLRLFT